MPLEHPEVRMPPPLLHLGGLLVGYGLDQALNWSLPAFAGRQGIAATLALIAIAVFGVGELIAWREGGIVLLGTLVGGYGAASAVRFVSQSRVRQGIIVVASGMTVYFFIAH